MLVYVVRRVLFAAPLLLLASVLTFALVANSGDPLAQLRSRQPPVPAHVIELRARQLHLDQPQPVRYWIWLRGFVVGDMGHSVGAI
jgi:peptide/nickel transport system permease protein